jgi:hypothetical protein
MKDKKLSKSQRTGDLPDSKKDKQHLQGDEATLDLPDVNDIPGQEHVHVPPLGELADTTISSDDEEAKGLLDDEEEFDDEQNESTVTAEEKESLRDAAETLPTRDQENIRRAGLEKRDEDGELLNEKSNLSGSDLDVPGSEDDDANEEIGEEDEENNSYSLPGEDEDNSTSRE